MTNDVTIPFDLWTRISLCIGIAVKQEPELVGEILHGLDKLNDISLTSKEKTN